MLEPREGAADHAEIRRTTAKLLAAVNASDHERLLAVWADDGVLMPPNRTAVQGRPALAAYFKERFSATRFHFAFTSSEIQLAGDVAFERLAYVVTAWPVAGGQATKDAGKGLHVYQRQPDGAWRLVLDIWNSDLPLEPRT
jgi:uncharacterized protein (TIGR02246 family)